MDSSPIPILHQQLNATLQLLVSLSSIMTTDDITLARIRLTEANILLGNVLSERSNGNLISTPLATVYLAPNSRAPYGRVHAAHDDS
jgi:hypothetical protein